MAARNYGRSLTTVPLPTRKEQQLGLELASLMDLNPWSGVRFDYSFTYTKLPNQLPGSGASESREGKPQTHQSAMTCDARKESSGTSCASSTTINQDGKGILWPPLTAFRRDGLWNTIYRGASILRQIVVVFSAFFGIFAAAVTVLGLLAFLVCPHIDFTNVDVRYSVDGVHHTVDLATVQEVSMQVSLPGAGMVLGLDFKGGRKIPVRPTVTVESLEVENPLDLAVPPEFASAPGFSLKVETLKFW